MIHQDVLMRQIRQFTNAIATLLGQSHRERPEETLRMIDQACKDHLDGSAENLRTLPPDALLGLCHEGSQFVPEAAESFAQTLQEMGEAYKAQAEPKKAGACFGRSLLLYRRLMNDPEAPVSWQVGTTVAALSERVDSFPVDDATQDALNALRNGSE